MTVLWTAQDAAVATNGRISGDWDGVTGLSIDTRELVPGDMFVALEGITHDGHVYVRQALDAGAGAALVSHVPDGCEGANLLVVDDTLTALQALGVAGRARAAAKVIGVTGSVGKTSTKEMLRSILAPQGRTHAATRSFNNHWGVPLTLARMPADTEFAVIEIGMNHAGEITPLSQMSRPDVALITTVEAVHLEAFDSVEGIADAKAEIFAGLVPGGAAILNADNPHFERLSTAAQAAKAKITSFGRASDDFHLKDVQTSGQATTISADIRGNATLIKLGTPGAHFALNALGALAAAEAAGADIGRAALDLGSWSPPDGRGSHVRLALPDGEILLLDESYNANPASVGAALAVLAASEPGRGPHRPGRRVAFLGDMLELGPTEIALHEGLAGLDAIDRIDKIHACGSRMKALHDALPVDKRGVFCADSVQLADAVEKVVDAGDVCMVKGSLGAAMRHVVSALRALGTPLSDSHTSEREDA
ncbi:MAG: UDP-N-acetylmuramoylalanyl-D-glutamyl-2,6-diaminopimelate--D-alanyl-D-alanine ligase [Pseudomonadota bacterium]